MCHEEDDLSEDLRLVIDPLGPSGYRGLLFLATFWASKRFAELHVDILKARDSKGDSGNFPCKTRPSKSLGFKSLLSAIVEFPNKNAAICAVARQRSGGDQDRRADAKSAHFNLLPKHRVQCRQCAADDQRAR